MRTSRGLPVWRGALAVGVVVGLLALAALWLSQRPLRGQPDLRAVVVAAAPLPQRPCRTEGGSRDCPCPQERLELSLQDGGGARLDACVGEHPVDTSFVVRRLPGSERVAEPVVGRALVLGPVVVGVFGATLAWLALRLLDGVGTVQGPARLHLPLRPPGPGGTPSPGAPPSGP